jgi:hypothetical protein
VNRTQLIHKINTTWSTFAESFAGLSESQLMQPGVVDSWSVKDIIAHVTAWEEEALKYLPLVSQGGRLPRYADMYGGIDAFNAQTIQHSRTLSLADVLRQFTETHQRLIDYLHSVPEELLTTETRFRRHVRLDTYSHYPPHTQMIRDWRSQNSP